MRKKILLVDDEADIRELMILRLEKAGYRIETVADGQEALDSVERDPPDLVLLDLRLPGMRGEEVCRRLKADDKLKRIPIILFTASVKHICEEFKECGADDCLVKPFEPAELLEKIKKFVK